MAISTSRFEPEAYAANVARSKADGLQTESHADNFERFDMINNADIDYVSTDFLAPDWHGQGETLAIIKGKGINKAQKASETCAAMSTVPFGAIYLEMEFTGSADVKLADQKFPIASGTPRQIRHQILLSDMLPVFELSEMSEDFDVRKFSIRVVEF